MERRTKKEMKEKIKGRNPSSRARREFERVSKGRTTKKKRRNQEETS